MPAVRRAADFDFNKSSGYFKSAAILFLEPGRKSPAEAGLVPKED
jgi:hypothetical protein